MKKHATILPVLLILMAIFAEKSAAQFAIYQSNPIGIISKERMKFEYRVDNNNSILLSVAGYWGLCPGVQIGTEYRNYHFITPRTEHFYYGKCGWGNGDEHGIDGGSTGNFNYAFAGGGTGLHFNIGKSGTFFFDLAGGLKGAVPVSRAKDQGSFQFFYISGPGSIVDINFHLGFQIGNKPSRNK